MAKQKISFICSQCDATTPKWLGCCPQCQSWNTIEEAIPSAAVLASKTHNPRQAPMVQLSAIVTQSKQRMVSTIKEWDRVTGGGIMRGAFIALTGDPGIGKSTLLLQVAHALAQQYTVAYFSSEESLEQVKLRAERLNCANTPILFSDHANLDEIIATAEQERPDLLIIDSVQNCYTSDLHALPEVPDKSKNQRFDSCVLQRNQPLLFCSAAISPKME